MTWSTKQLRAALAVAKASLIATLRSATSVVFSLLFPVIFIVVFGSMINNAIVELRIALAPGCDTSNVVYHALANISNISIDNSLSSSKADDALKKGRLAAIINIKKDTLNTPLPYYSVLITSSASSGDAAALLQTLLNNAIASLNKNIFPDNHSVASLITKELPGRTYRQIDFILPGQLGFSLLMAGVFGSAFLLFSLRKNLVLKAYVNSSRKPHIPYYGGNDQPRFFSHYHFHHYCCHWLFCFQIYIGPWHIYFF